MLNILSLKQRVKLGFLCIFSHFHSATSETKAAGQSNEDSIAESWNYW